MVQFPFPQLWDSEKMAGGNNGGEKGSALPPLMVSKLRRTVGEPNGWLGQHFKARRAEGEELLVTSVPMGST